MSIHVTPSWLSQALIDPETTDICINGSQQVYVDRGNGLELQKISNEDQWTENQLKDWILAELSKVGKTWDARYPFVDASLISGHRVHVAFPPLARQGILISLRRAPQARMQSSQKKVTGAERWKSSPLYSFLAQRVRCGDSLLISGATGSGKTTLANDLLAEAPMEERIVALEDTPELMPDHPHFLSLVSRPPNADGYGEVTLRVLLKQTLRMRPDRIILGECRGGEVLDLLQALNTGHRGALATLHANSPRDALRRLELLCLLTSSGTIPVPVIRELLSLGIQWVAQVTREGSQRKISECWRIEGREGDTILMRQVLESNSTWIQI
jgi:pilus assembly protein CpaF